MGEGRPKGLWALWKAIDGRLRGISDGLRKGVKALRIVRAALVLGLLITFAGAGIAIWRPEYLPYAYLAGVVFLSIPLIILTVVVSLPLRAKSIVRLIDIGYPQNVKELAIRFAARKLHEQSIETEELLAETAWNESKKLLRKYRDKARRVQEVLDKEEADGESADDDGRNGHNGKGAGPEEESPAKAKRGATKKKARKAAKNGK